MPIYAQLVEVIRRAVATGHLGIGDQLPTVRQLAVDLRINPNTVARAYTELERAGVIATQQGRGTFVKDLSAAGAGVRDSVRLAEIAKQALLDAHGLGFTPQELVEAVESQVATDDGTGRK